MPNITMIKQNIYKTIFILLVILLVTFVIIITYNSANNRIINYPAETVVLLNEKMRLPLNESFTPPYNYTLNASIIKNQKDTGYMSAFHVDISPSNKFYRTLLFISTFNDNFSEVKLSKIYVQPTQSSEDDLKTYLVYSPQDPRLIYLKDKLILIFNDADKLLKRHMYIGEVSEKSKHMELHNVRKLSVTDSFTRNEKNWIPFVYNDELYFIYSISPNLILKFNQDTENVMIAHANRHSFGDQWHFGELRGGTPAIYVKDFDAYLCFFHSMLPYRAKDYRTIDHHKPYSRIYYMGAFIFESKPPFNIIAYTKKPISFKDQYKNIDLYYNIIFPMGVIENDKDFLVSAGIQDSKTILFNIDKADLYEQFVYLK